MIHPSHGVQVFVATKPVDFRKGHDGLAALVQGHLKKKPFGLVPFTFWSVNSFMRPFAQKPMDFSRRAMSGDGAGYRTR